MRRAHSLYTSPFSRLRVNVFVLQNLGLANKQQRRSAPSPAFHRRNGDHDASAGFPTKLGTASAALACSKRQGSMAQISVGGCDAPQMRPWTDSSPIMRRSSTYGPRPRSLLSRQQAKTAVRICFSLAASLRTIEISVVEKTTHS